MKRISLIVVLMLVAVFTSAQEWGVVEGDSSRYIVGHALQVEGAVGGSEPILMYTEDSDGDSIVMIMWGVETIHSGTMPVQFEGEEARNWTVLYYEEFVIVVDRSQFLEAMFEKDFVTAGVRSDRGRVLAGWSLRGFRTVYREKW
jgi:hypothetical protein